MQYLRLLHNFCDRDCDNYSGRRLLLSSSEIQLVFSDKNPDQLHKLSQHGLLLKIISTFMHEPDDSPYKFWLASCVEAYLRGSSQNEQLYASRSGLLRHLIQDILSDRLHCAGSLQTAFDLLGELCKGNTEALHMLLRELSEEDFHRLMSVAAANLVDSNVFMRSLLLSIERLAASMQQDLKLKHSSDFNDKTDDICFDWKSDSGPSLRSYLTHSWWDIPSITDSNDDEEFFSIKGLGGLVSESTSLGYHQQEMEKKYDQQRKSDWFPPFSSITNQETYHLFGGKGLCLSGCDRDTSSSSEYLEDVSHLGWIFTPQVQRNFHEKDGNNVLDVSAVQPNTIGRLSWFIYVNQARLLRDLLRVVDLRNINHENICCLNTAVVVAIFAHRRNGLAHVISELRRMNEEERKDKQEREQKQIHCNDDTVDSFLSSFLSLDINSTRNPRKAQDVTYLGHNKQPMLGDRADALRNFRELLWFWTEYYTHRGRDRLSLEFSSHLRFQEWNNVVQILCADDGSSTALLSSPVRLPRSPYTQSPRTVDVRLRSF